MCVCVCPAGSDANKVRMCVSAGMCESVVSLFACVKQLLLDEFHTEIIDGFLSSPETLQPNFFQKN